MFTRLAGLLPGRRASAVEGPDRSHVLFNYYCEYDAEKLMWSFVPSDTAPHEGLVTNFLGVRIPPKIMPGLLGPMAGTVEGFPLPGNWHADIAEWASALKSVQEAVGSYRIVEVGCGWAFWLTNMGVVAKRRGLDVELIGIEGDAHHLENARETLKLNGLSDSEARLFHGVAGPKPGVAFFPNNEAGSEKWGGEAIFYPDEVQSAALRADPGYNELICFTLQDISGSNPVDLLHVDIQGAEFDFVSGNFADIDALVRRILIGTHSRQLDGKLMEFFLDHDWILEMERPSISHVVNGAPQIVIDGVQAWKNPKLP